MGELFPIRFPIFPFNCIGRNLVKEETAWTSSIQYCSYQQLRVLTSPCWQPVWTHAASGCCQLCFSTNPPSGLRTWREEARLPLRLLHILLRSFYHNSTLLKLEVLAGWQLAISRGLRGREASALRAASQQELCVFSLMFSDSLALPNEWSADERRSSGPQPPARGPVPARGSFGNGPHRKNN